MSSRAARLQHKGTLLFLYRKSSLQKPVIHLELFSLRNTTYPHTPFFGSQLFNKLVFCVFIGPHLPKAARDLLCNFVGISLCVCAYGQSFLRMKHGTAIKLSRNIGPWPLLESNLTGCPGEMKRKRIKCYLHSWCVLYRGLANQVEFAVFE